MGFVVEKLSMGHGFLRALQFSFFIIIPPMLYKHFHSFIYRRRRIILTTEGVVK